MLVVLQGRDAAGKDGAIRGVFGRSIRRACAATSLQGADRGGAAPRLPLAGPSGRAAAGHDRDLQPLALRGRARGAGAQAGAGAGLAAALRADQRFERILAENGTVDPEVPAAHLARGAAGAAAGAARGPGPSTGSSTRGICGSGSSGTTTPRPTGRCWRGPARPGRPGTWCPPTASRLRDVLVARGGGRGARAHEPALSAARRPSSRSCAQAARPHDALRSPVGPHDHEGEVAADDEERRLVAEVLRQGAA